MKDKERKKVSLKNDISDTLGASIICFIAAIIFLIFWRMKLFKYDEVHLLFAISLIIASLVLFDSYKGKKEAFDRRYQN